MYYPAQSNTASFVGGGFGLSYGTGSVKGQYWSDTMTIASTFFLFLFLLPLKPDVKSHLTRSQAVFRVPSVQFAVASDSNYTYSGVLGLGYAYPIALNYPSVLNLMVSQKFIGAPIFSLGLGGEQAGFSEIIFGGVNQWKFTGPLEPVPIWPPIKDQDPHWIQYVHDLTLVP